jgi:hypothetical protein
MRDMPAVTRDIAGVRNLHARSLEAARSGDASKEVLADLARSDAELCAFDDMCMRTRTMHLMSTGLDWGEQLRNPAHPGTVVLVRTGDRVEMDGAEMGIREATGRLSKSLGRGIDVGLWSNGSIVLEEALGLRHPPRTAGILTEGAQAAPEAVRAEGMPPVATPVQESLF